MTEEIIIDGVNVAGCKYYHYKGCTANNLCKCGNSINCYFKQLKRSEQENKHYKQLLKGCSADGDDCGFCEIDKRNKELEQENKELKKDVQLFKCLDTFGESECHCACRCLGNEFCEDAEIKINKYKTALEEIRDYCKFNFVSANPILNKINEVLNDI